MSDMDTKVARAAKEAEEKAAELGEFVGVSPVDVLDGPSPLDWTYLQIRQWALDNSMKLHTSGVYLKDNGDISTRVQATREDVVATAEAFLAFLTGGAK